MGNVGLEVQSEGGLKGCVYISLTKVRYVTRRNVKEAFLIVVPRTVTNGAVLKLLQDRVPTFRAKVRPERGGQGATTSNDSFLGVGHL